MGTGYNRIIFYKNWISQLRQVKRNAMLFGVPILIFVFMDLFFSYNKVEERFIEPLNVGMVIEDESPYADILAEGLITTKGFQDFIHLTSGNREDLERLFDSGALDALVIMPDGFVESVMTFSSNPIIVKVSYTQPLKAVLIRNILMGYEKYITSVETGVMTLWDQMEFQGFDKETILVYNEQISIDLIFTAISRGNFYEYHEIVDVPSVNSTTYYFIAIVMMFLMYISLFSAIHLIQEREEMCLTRLKITKISMNRYLANVTLSNTVFVGGVVLLWYGLYHFLLGSLGTHHMTELGIFILCAIFFDICLATLVTAFFEKTESVILIASVFIFINAVIGGSIIPLHMMPKVLSNMAMFSPNYWMIRGALYLQSGYHLQEAYLIGGCLLLLSVLMLMVAARKYRKSW